MELKEIIIFTVCGREYGMGIEHMQGIEEETQIIPVADAPGYVEGIVNIRNEVVPVFSLEKKFQLNSLSDTTSGKFLLVKVFDQFMACKVDDVKEMRKLLDHEIHSFPSMIQSDETAYVDFVANINGRLILIIKPDQLIEESDRKHIGNLINHLQKKE